MQRINIQCNVALVIIRQIVSIPPLYLNNYAQHNTTQFTHLTFNNHSTIFQGQHYGITITKIKILQSKINTLGSG